MNTTELTRGRCESNCGCAPTTAVRNYQPAADVIERPDRFQIVADVPGARQEDIDIRVEENTLTLHARVAERAQPGRALRSEYNVGDFRRMFRLGEGIDATQISAELAHGVLTVNLPKREQSRSRRIEVKTQ